MIWTPEDLQRLRDLYKIATKDEILSALPGRTWAAIYKQARKVGLAERQRANGDYWTAEETALLKEAFKQGSKASLMEALPGRTWWSITQKARSMGMTKPFASKWWRPEELAALSKHYETAEKDALMALVPKRSWMSIIQKGQDLGLTRKAWMSIRKPQSRLHPLIKAIRQRRIAIKATQAQIAKIAGFGVCTIQALESGETRNVTFAALEAVAGALGYKFQLVPGHPPDPTGVPDWLRRIIKERMPKTNLISFENFDREDSARWKKRRAA